MVTLNIRPPQESEQLKRIEVKGVSEENFNEELKREIVKGAKLESAPETKKQEVDLSAEKALLEKLRAEGKLEEED